MGPIGVPIDLGVVNLIFMVTEVKDIICFLDDNSKTVRAVILMLGIDMPMVRPDA